MVTKWHGVVEEAADVSQRDGEASNVKMYLPFPEIEANRFLEKIYHVLRALNLISF